MADPTARFILTGEDRTAALFKSVGHGLDELGHQVRSVHHFFSAFGLALGARELVQWTKDALDAKNLTADQAEVLGNASEALGNLNKGFGDIARTIATEFAPAVQNAAEWWHKLLFPTSEQKVGDELDKLHLKASELAKALVDGPPNALQSAAAGGTAKWLANTRKELDALLPQMRALEEQQKKLREIPPPPDLTQKEWVALESFLFELNHADISKGQALSAPLAEFIDQLKTAASLSEQLQTPLEKDLELVAQVRDLMAKGLLPADSIARLGDELLQPIIVAKGMLHELKPEAEKWAQELGQGMKSAFAGWLAGTETSFRDLLKRMAAELVSSALFSALASTFGGGGGFWASVFGGKRANGGPVSAGRSYLVGERGPEVVTMGASGFVTPNGGGGLVYAPVTNIDARNAAPGVEGGIRALIEQNNRRQKAEIADLIRRGRFAK